MQVENIFMIATIKGGALFNLRFIMNVYQLYIHICISGISEISYNTLTACLSSLLVVLRGTV